MSKNNKKNYGHTTCPFCGGTHIMGFRKWFNLKMPCLEKRRLEDKDEKKKAV